LQWWDGLDVVLDLLIEMEVQLGVGVVLEGAAMDQGAKASFKIVEHRSLLE
jgi:hypothetical protein